MPKSSRRIAHERVIFLQALAGGLPAVVVAMCYLWFGDASAKVQWTLSLLIVGCWLGFAAAVQARVIRPLQTMANLLSALREGDFSVRARGARRDEPLGDVMAEINILSRTLQDQRLSALEATALLRTVMEEIDVAIFAFDAEGRMRLANHAGQMLLNKPAERILGRDAKELGLEDWLTGEPGRLLTLQFPGGGNGRWGMRRSQFHEGGRPHHLVVIADLSRSLREEELRAWQRLVRVLGHELNNSLAPIKSLAGSLASMVRRTPRPPDWEEDLQSALAIIESRADGLSRFMQAYARLARLPAPVLAPCEVCSLVERVAALETRLTVEMIPGPSVTVSCDAAQIEQVLINLLKNAVDAALETGGGVRIGCSQAPGRVEIFVEDDGPGIGGATNLFVPFYTTKPEGSGIGLVLCRQIAENHRGTLVLENRQDAPGCVARLRLPI
ncbi:MAG TPA: ATP-binding protein [Opitutaceae bacterium]|nr:ATP-binding protein [Opitutaceae bacterium]HND61937.1 ATP-binding protein [Opitutaceae bacterium]